MSSKLRRLVLEKTQEVGLALALVVAGAAVLCLPELGWTNELGAIKISVAIIATTLGIEIIVRSLKTLLPEEPTKLRAFYTNRHESRESWRAQMAKVHKTLIVCGATAQILLIETGDIKRILRNSNGKVIIIVPNLLDNTRSAFYEKMIGATSLRTGFNDMRSKYDSLLLELENEGLAQPEQRLILIEHEDGAPFGMTLYDPEEQDGMIRVELYGLTADDRPSIDITRKTNILLYLKLCIYLQQWLGFNPSMGTATFIRTEKRNASELKQPLQQ